MKRLPFLLVLLVLAAVLAQAEDPATNAAPVRVSPEALRDLGETQGRPVLGGFLFVGGEYVAAPYVVSRRGNAVFVNDRLVRSEEWPWTPPPTDEPTDVSATNPSPESNDARVICDHTGDIFWSPEWHAPKEVVQRLESARGFHEWQFLHDGAILLGGNGGGWYGPADAIRDWFRRALPIIDSDAPSEEKKRRLLEIAPEGLLADLLAEVLDHAELLDDAFRARVGAPPRDPAAAGPAARVTVVSGDDPFGKFVGKEAVATTNGWCRLGSANVSSVRGNALTREILFEARAFRDGVLVAETSSLSRNDLSERSLARAERFLRWDELPASVAYGAATVRVERAAADAAPSPTRDSNYDVSIADDRDREPWRLSPGALAEAWLVPDPPFAAPDGVPVALSREWAPLAEFCREHPACGHEEVRIRARLSGSDVEVERESIPLPGDGRVLRYERRTVPAESLSAEIVLPEGIVRLRPRPQ